LQLDLDVRDGNGKALAIATSAQDSYAAHAVLTYLAAPMTGKGVSRALRDSVISRLYDVVSEDDGASRLDQEFDRYFRSNMSAEEESLWDLFHVADTGSFMDKLTLFADAYMLIVSLPIDADGVLIVKYRYVEHVLNGGTFRERMGIVPLIVEVDAASMLSASRAHLRVVAPTGTEIRDARLLPVGVHHKKRISRERAVIYARSGDVTTLDPLTIEAQIVVPPARFTWPAFACILLMLLTVIPMLILEHLYKRFSDGSLETSSAAAIVVLIPTLAALFIVQSGEHPLLTRLLITPRVVLACAAAPPIAVAATISAGVSSMWVMVSLWSAIAIEVSALLLFAIVIINGLEPRADSAT
jgi:hypothetical protein